MLAGGTLADIWQNYISLKACHKQYWSHSKTLEGGHQVGLSTSLSHLFHQWRWKMAERRCYNGALSQQSQSIKGKTKALHAQETRKSGSDDQVVVYKVVVVLISSLFLCTCRWTCHPAINIHWDPSGAGRQWYESHAMVSLHQPEHLCQGQGLFSLSVWKSVSNLPCGFLVQNYTQDEHGGHLAAKDSNIHLRSWRRPKQS